MTTSNRPTRTIREVHLDDPEAVMCAYKKTGDGALRNQLVMHYLPHVNAAIYSMRSILFSNVPFDDLFNEGILALMDCIERYEPDRGATFDTYSYMGIRGAILKYLRKQNWLPNRTWEARKTISAGRSELEQRLMREPTDAELAEYLKMTPKQLSQLIVEISSADTVSFEEMLEQAYEHPSIHTDAEEESVGAGLLKKELRDTLAKAIEALPPREKQVVSLYYYENLNLREIGEVLELSQQRVSQIRKKALDQLTQAMKEYQDD
ncbi:MAG: FliA/WhiG family RNA polymerase sigma factor [Faecalibacterium sp.]|jgi:RNA polymerase sigma factor for flagellar operon FliA|nr:FliA/WhiG family RNA polymerase sigma factor [Faecalibacterium sp.]